MAVDESDDVVYLGDDIGDSGEDLIIYQKVEDNYSSIKNIDYNGINESHIEPEKMYIYNNLEIV